MAIEHLAHRDARAEWAPDPDRSRLSWHRESGSGKIFYVLRQRGDFVSLCHDHGRLFGAEVERGVFPEILDSVAVDTDAERATLDIVFRALFLRIVDDLKAACIGELQDGIKALSDGYRRGADQPRYGPDEVTMACLAIDAGNVATGFTRRLKRYGSTDFPLGETLAYVVGALRRFGEVPSRAASADEAGLVRALVAQGERARLGMGCTGFAVPPRWGAEGKALHARTFDSAFFDWNATPGLHLVDETDGHPGWCRYAAVGTVGLVYPGGISGINEAGLACSLHQMSTTTYSTGKSGGGFAIAPYVQQRILREARSLDDAERIVRASEHFASWAILVSSASEAAAATFEIAARGADGTERVRRIDHGPAAIQTNHFRHDALEERFAWFEDAHFTKSFGKWRESRARETSTETRLGFLGRGPGVGVDGALGLMAAHDDADLPRTGTGDFHQRSFGRTVCKAYGLMASVARAHPDRTPGADELWVTMGEALPGPHSHLAGFSIDWSAFTLTPIGAIPPGGDPRLREAYALYVEAHRIFVRPRRGEATDTDDRGFLGRALSAEERARTLRLAISKLSQALEIWRAAMGEPDFPTLYIRARLTHELATCDGIGGQTFATALTDWRELLRFARRGTTGLPVTAYERALVRIHAAATLRALGEDAEARALAAEGREGLEEIRRETFGARGGHPGLSELHTLAGDLEIGKRADLPPVDFVTVE